jgi:hypothetical protein
LGDIRRRDAGRPEQVPEHLGRALSLTTAVQPRVERMTQTTDVSQQAPRGAWRQGRERGEQFALDRLRQVAGGGAVGDDRDRGTSQGAQQEQPGEHRRDPAERRCRGQAGRSTGDQDGGEHQVEPGGQRGQDPGPGNRLSRQRSPAKLIYQEGSTVAARVEEGLFTQDRDRCPGADGGQRGEQPLLQFR